MEKSYALMYAGHRPIPPTGFRTTTRCGKHRTLDRKSGPTAYGIHGGWLSIRKMEHCGLAMLEKPVKKKYQSPRGEQTLVGRFSKGLAAVESADMTNTDPKLVSAYLCHKTPGFTKPVVSYNHEVGCAVVGGIVYRGTAIPWLTGVYLFGDYCTGRVWALAGDADSGWLMLEVADLDQQLSSFGTDANGEVLILTFDGPLRRLVDAEAVYAPSVTHKTLTTIVRAPLDTRAPPTPRVRGP